MERLETIRLNLQMGGKLSTEDKNYIRSKAAEYSIEIKSTRCRNCWHDIIVLIESKARRVNKMETATERTGPQLREPFRTYGLRWNGRNVTQSMMNENLYSLMIAAKLGHLFEPYEHEVRSDEDII